jgi:SRSO17 transposase
MNVKTLALGLPNSAFHNISWRIERDYQDLKQDLGLGHYEGRGWKGFHHHATLSIVAYGFLMAQRLKTGSDAGGKKTSSNSRLVDLNDADVRPL